MNTITNYSTNFQSLGYSLGASITAAAIATALTKCVGPAVARTLSSASTFLLNSADQGGYWQAKLALTIGNPSQTEKDRMLEHALDNRNHPLAKLLIRHHANPAADNAYLSRAERAVCTGQPEMVRTLFSEGVDIPFASVKKFLYQAINRAYSEDRLNTLSALLESGRYTQAQLTVALHDTIESAFADNSSRSFPVKEQSLPIIRLLIKHGADVNEMKRNLTPIQRAFAYGNRELVELLWDAGAEWNEFPSLDGNPYRKEIEDLYRERASSFIQKSFDTNFVTPKGHPTFPEESIKLITKYV